MNTAMAISYNLYSQSNPDTFYFSKLETLLLSHFMPPFQFFLQCTLHLKLFHW